MNLAINLESSTVSEKLNVMEQLWANLSQSAEKNITPAWHKEVLATRLLNVENGQSEFVDWKVAKEQLRA